MLFLWYLHLNVALRIFDSLSELTGPVATAETFSSLNRCLTHIPLLFRAINEFSASHPQLSDFWLRDVPSYLPAHSTKACRVVCRSWAEVYLLPNIKIQFPITFDDIFNSGRVFQLSQSISIRQSDPAHDEAMEKLLTVWKSTQDVSIITSLRLECPAITAKAGPLLVHLLRHVPLVRFYAEESNRSVSNISIQCHEQMLEALAAAGTICELDLAVRHDSVCKALAEQAPKFHQLTKLTLRVLDDSLPQFESLFSSLSQMASLNSLVLPHTTFEEESLPFLTDAIECIESSLTSLELFLEQSPPSVSHNFAQALASNAKLTNLILHDFHLEDRESMQQLGSALESNSTLKRLTLDVESPYEDFDLEPIFVGLQNNKSLERLELRLSCTANGDHIMLEPLIAALAENTSLTSLTLADCFVHIQSELWDVLASSNTTLKELCFEGVTFHHGLERNGLRELLLTNTCLETLKFANTFHISAASNVQLVRGLRLNGNSRLSHLDLSCVGMDADVATEIALLLRSSNCPIRHLGLNFVGLQISMTEIFRALTENRSMIMLDLSGSPHVSEGDYALLADVLKQNDTLSTLRVRQLSPRIRTQFEESLSSRANHFGLSLMFSE
jgi:hypothetical protein